MEYICQLKRYFRTCVSNKDFVDRTLMSARNVHSCLPIGKVEVITKFCSRHHDWLNVMECQCHSSVSPRMTGATSGAGTACPSGIHGFNPVWLVFSRFVPCRFGYYIVCPSDHLFDIIKLVLPIFLYLDVFITLQDIII